jgi:hypothetical protein
MNRKERERSSEYRTQRYLQKILINNGVNDDTVAGPISDGADILLELYSIYCMNEGGAQQRMILSVCKTLRRQPFPYLY